jgi:hypothetical protein
MTYLHGSLLGKKGPFAPFHPDKVLCFLRAQPGVKKYGEQCWEFLNNLWGARNRVEK